MSLSTSGRGSRLEFDQRWTQRAYVVINSIAKANERLDVAEFSYSNIVSAERGNMAIARDEQVIGIEEPHREVLMFKASDDHVELSNPGPDNSSKGDGLMSPPPRPDSLVSRVGNRLSLSLPIQAGERDSNWLARHEPTDLDWSSAEFSQSLDFKSTISKISPNEFLVALASQERRVLELKEELYRAETQLKKLKREWASHELSRKTVPSSFGKEQHDDQQFQHTGPGIGMVNGGEGKEESRRRSLNMHVDRRNAILTEPTRVSRRKVITGGHTRALSLLSPVQGSHGQNALVAQSNGSAKQHTMDMISSPTMTQAPLRAGLNQLRYPHQGSTAIGVKQIAEDIKSGLWTFMEDLRQATVGEEAVKGEILTSADLTPKRSTKKVNRGSPTNVTQSLSRSPQGKTLASKTRETEHERHKIPANKTDLGEGAMAAIQTPSVLENNIETVTSLDDDWSNWDSPVSKNESGRWSSSTALSSQPTSNGFSPSTQSRSVHRADSPKLTIKPDETKWPAFSNFTPSNIKYTASAIIKEWEKSLTLSSQLDESNHLPLELPVLARKTTDEESRLLLNNLP